MTTLTNPATYAILLALALLAIAYAWLVRRLRRRTRNHGQTAWLVVVGDSLVTLALVAVVAANYSIDYAIEIGIVAFACLLVAGIPMIVEYLDDHLAQRSHDDERNHTQQISDRLAQILGLNDD